MTMKNIIRIKNAAFYGYHGFFSSEQKLGGRFEVDVEIHTDFSMAAEADSLDRTVDYGSVYKLVDNIFRSRKYRLIETLAVDMAIGIFSGFRSIERVVIRVRKLHAPVGGYIDCAEAEVDMDQNEYMQWMSDEER